MPTLFCIVALCLFTAASARAQPAAAELSGLVLDPSGAAVGGAAVRATEAATNQSYSSLTGGTGVYALTGLRPGLYAVTFEARGFKRLTREGVRVATGERLRLDAKLAIGGVEESITVRSDAPLLRSESGSLGQVIGNTKIVELPLNGRSFIPLVGLAAGVALPPGSAFPRINGGRPRTNEYLFDGISVLQPEPGQVAFVPVIDSIQEFKVESNSPSAEFGRFNGGVVNLTTKSGTNELHGSAFEFLRNEALNARNLFAPKTTNEPGKPLFRRNQFGFVLGGPVIRDRSFFFVDYQGTRQQIGRVRISTVPTALERQGAFTETAGGQPLIYDPATTRPGPGGAVLRDPFAGDAIPAARLDPVARALLGRYPPANSSGIANNYRRVGAEGENQDQFDLRLDHSFSAADKVFGRFSYANDDATPVAPLPDGSGSITTGATGPTATLGLSFASSWLHVLGPRATNEVRAGYTRRSVSRAALLLAAPPAQSLGLPGIPSTAAFPNTLPTFLIDGFQQLGPPPNTESDSRTDVTELVDTLSLQRGSHSLKTGLDLRFERLDILQPPSPTGTFHWSSLFTDLPGGAPSGPRSGNPLASFLLGQVQDFSIDLQSRPIRPRAQVQEYFVQDDWKAAPRLTISAGVRYTLNFPSTEADNQGAVFNLGTQQLQYLGRNGFPRSSRELHKHDFGPRFGIAWRATDRTVVRSGYGLIWIEQAGITTPFTNPQFPFLQTVGQRTLDNINPAFVLASGPSVQSLPLTADAGLGQGVFSVDRSLGSGYAQQWNFSIQREIGPNISVEAGYAGSKITHVGIPDTNINQLTAGQLALGPALTARVPNPFFPQIPASSSLAAPLIPQAQLLRPFPRFTTVSLFRNNVGNTNYHSLQAKVEKRFSHGLSLLASYTRSKLIDEASSVFDAAILTGPVANFPVADSFNRKLERDVSSGDIPNVFVASFTYDLPFGAGRRFQPHGVPGRLLRGWSLAGSTVVQSGLPLAVTQATNFNAFAGFGVQRPNRIANPELPAAERSTGRFFNTDAFTAAPAFTLGSSSRNPVRGPAYRDADLAVINHTAIGERANVEIRGEVFNLANTPPLGTPNVVLGTPGFGSITSALDPRVIQLAVKVNF
ncbi:MAG TPA: TonB-dependent receptor, partial [Bryobacterales bacterium]|nr:TonB-dependent receptor [Bryobacterales bacterium]